LINASPDILHQIASNPTLHPRGGAVRDTPIRGIILVDSQLDHTLGLLLLREGKPLRVYCTNTVRADLMIGNPIFELLQSYCGIEWRELFLGKEGRFEIEELSGLWFQAVSLSSKAPPYSARRGQKESPGSNIALLIEEPASKHRLFYAPGLGHIDEAVTAAMRTATCIIVDGTFWKEDEMLKTGAGVKHASDMGHLPQSGPDGMLAVLAQFPETRRILVHINNTNPILDEDSKERQLVEQAKIEVAYDGMIIDLFAGGGAAGRQEAHFNV
jgi:pyrroloquinoline quinone biosynthesis protein B